MDLESYADEASNVYGFQVSLRGLCNRSTLECALGRTDRTSALKAVLPQCKGMKIRYCGLLDLDVFTIKIKVT